MVKMDFTPSPVYSHLQVTVISDDGWCWDLAWKKLGVLIVDCIPLTDLASVQLGNLSNCIDGLQALPQVQDLNEIISGRVCNLSDIWIYFLLRYTVLLQLDLSFKRVVILLRTHSLFYNPRFGLHYSINN